jgi:hypothetical protein
MAGKTTYAERLLNVVFTCVRLYDVRGKIGGVGVAG